MGEGVESQAQPEKKEEEEEKRSAVYHPPPAGSMAVIVPGRTLNWALLCSTK